MATVNYTTTNDWAQITEAGTDKDFILQNLSRAHYAEACFSASAPAVDAPAHPIAPEGSMIRAGVAGALYVRSRVIGHPVKLAVSAAA